MATRYSQTTDGPQILFGHSLGGAVVFNLFLAINHRRDRYIAT